MDGCSRRLSMHMHVYCEEGRIGASDPVVNEKIVGDNAVGKACFTGNWGGVEAGAHIGNFCWLCRDSVLIRVVGSTQPHLIRRTRERICATLIDTYRCARQHLGLPSL